MRGRSPFKYGYPRRLVLAGFVVVVVRAAARAYAGGVFGWANRRWGAAR